MNQISKFTQSFALVLFATTAATNLIAEDTTHEKIKYLEKEQQKNNSWYRAVQKAIAEYYFPIAAAAGVVVAYYLYSYKKSDIQNSKLPASVLGPDAYKSLCSLYAAHFFTCAYIDKKVAQPFVRKHEKERKTIAKAIEKLRKDMIKH